MPKSYPKFQYFPKTQPPFKTLLEVTQVFKEYENSISTLKLDNGLKSDAVLKLLATKLEELGFEVERGKAKSQKIQQPVYFGAQGKPTLTYEIDAYHPRIHCGIEIEAGRAVMGNAIYRDLIRSMLMADLQTLILAVPIQYKYRTNGKSSFSRDYEQTSKLAELLYSNDRFRPPYNLLVIGY